VINVLWYIQTILQTIIKNLYKNSFGIESTEDDTPLKIILETNVSKGKYFESLPLHHSQSIHQMPNQHINIHLELCPRYDFMMELLSHGNDIKILAPKSLVKEMKKIIAEMGKLYL
jgi:predicted DNA-binding transcriptional regulator YafY